MKENEPAKGVWPPAATPFHADLSIDFERYIAHCHALLAEGAHGLAVLGTTSEANSLDLGEREVVLERLVAAGIAAEKLLPGTGASSTETAGSTRAGVTSTSSNRAGGRLNTSSTSGDSGGASAAGRAPPACTGR